MNITLSISELFIFFGGLTALILTTAFIIRTQKSNLTGIWLIGFCLANVFVIFVKFLFSTEYIFELSHLLRWKYPIGLSRPVLFFLFILFLFKGYKKLNWKYLLHFIPVVIVFIYFIPFFFSPSIEKTSWLKGELLLPNASLPGWYFYFISAYSFCYLAASFFIFMRNKHSTQKLLNLFIFSIFIGTVVFLIFAILNIYSGGSPEINNYMYLVLSAGFLVVSLIILASPNALKISRTSKYRSSNIDQKRSLHIFKKALKAIDKHKLYKNAELKISDLADMINEPSYLLSHAINQQTTKSFNDFINQMRIDEAALLIADGKHRHLTLEAIGYEVGFNSRSSFYSAFKKIKSSTPASYKKAVAI